MRSEPLFLDYNVNVCHIDGAVKSPCLSSCISTERDHHRTLSSASTSCFLTRINANYSNSILDRLPELAGVPFMTATAAPLLCLAFAFLLAHTGLSQVLGDVFMYEPGRGESEPVHFDPFPDLPADFGPEVPDEGVDGLLLMADPEDACQPLRTRCDDEPWVALISRSQHLHPTNCTFDVKVRYAELAGASAAIVYDDVYEALIIMSKPRDHPEPNIPAVFVSEKAGIIMRKLMTPGVTRVRIIPVSASAWMSLLMSAFLGFLALTVVLATFYVMRSWSLWLGRTRRRGMHPDLAGLGAAGPQASAQEGLPACAIRALPILIYEGKGGRRRSSSSSQAPQQQLGVAAQPVPIAQAAPSAAAVQSAVQHAAWMEGSPIMPATPHTVPTSTTGPLQQQVGVVQQSSCPTESAVVLIGPQGGWRAHGCPSGQQQPGSFGSMTSGLISLASLAAEGSRRVLLLGAASPSSSPPLGTHMPGSRPGTCGSTSSTTAHPAGTAADRPGPDVVAAAQMEGAAGGGAQCPGDLSCGSSPFSTDDEELDPPEVVQSWPGAGGMVHVVTGGPVGARGGATRHTCVVCLERYSAGDKMRLLPCQHRFHAKCIDPWLSSRRLCPVCKHDASMWPSNSLQAVMSAEGLPQGTQTAAVAAGQHGISQTSSGMDLLSAPLSAGVLSSGQGFWFRGIRARLVRAHRRRQQQQRQHLQQHQAQVPLLAGSDGGLDLGTAPVVSNAATAAAAAAAAAEAAEAGLLQTTLPGGAADAVQEPQVGSGALDRP